MSYWRDKSRFCEMMFKKSSNPTGYSWYEQKKKTVDTRCFKKIIKTMNRTAQKVVRKSISLFQSRPPQKYWNKNKTSHGDFKISSNCILHVNALQRKYTFLLIIAMTRITDWERHQSIGDVSLNVILIDLNIRKIKVAYLG